MGIFKKRYYKKDNKYLKRALYTPQKKSANIDNLEKKSFKMPAWFESMVDAVKSKRAGMKANLSRKAKSSKVLSKYASRTENTWDYPDENKDFYIKVSAICGGVALAAMLLFGVILTPEKYNITVNDGGKIVSAITTEKTVGDFLDKNAIAMDDMDVLNYTRDQDVFDGMELYISRAYDLTVNTQDKQINVKLLAGTVEDVLERAGVELSEDDEVYPAKGTYITSGMNIEVIRVKTETITKTETIEYSSKTVEDPTLAKGKKKVVQYGSNGTRKVKIKITYKNGEEYSRKVISSEVTKQPVNEIIHIGTKTTTNKKPVSNKPTNNGGSSNTGGTSNTTATEWYRNYISPAGKLTKIPSRSQVYSSSLAAHKKVPAPSASIIKETVTLYHCTAYTWTGNKTATGRWPQVGTIAADPKKFPYGTIVYVPGYGYGVIEDTGSMRHRAETLWDLYMPTKSECTKWGRKYNYKVYILK